jgi:hypothetical protein
MQHREEIEMQIKSSRGRKDTVALDAEAGALLLPPEPPPPGTVRLLFAKGTTWSMREGASSMQLDVKIMPETKSWTARLKGLLSKEQ